MATPHSTKPARQYALAHMPPTIFTVVMGITGLGLAWRAAAEALGLTKVIGETLIIVGAILGAFLVCAYGLKILMRRDSFWRDVQDPNVSNYFSTLTFAIMLVAAGVLKYTNGAALVCWLIAAPFHFVLTIRQIRLWVTHNHEITASNPSWFLPVGGCLLAPDLGFRFGFVELSWALFSLGFLYWILLFGIVLNRIIFHDQLPTRYIPTLFIIIAPPALGFMSYQTLMGGEIDAFARILFYSALATTMLVFSLVRLFSQLPFALSWWAYTFPLDAMTIAAWRYGQAAGSRTIENFAIVLLGVTTVIVGLVALRTLKAFIHGALFLPESE